MIQLKTQQCDLKDAFNKVAFAVSTSNAVDSHVVFEVTKEGVRLHTSSMRLYGSTLLTCSVLSGQGIFTIEGARLKQCLSALDAKAMIDLSYDDESSQVILSTSRTKIPFQSLSTKGFPFLRKGDFPEKSWSVPAEVLGRALSFQTLAIDPKNDTQNPALTVTECRDSLFYSCCAGLACVSEILDLDSACGLRIHVKDIKTIAGFLSSSLGDGDITVYESDKDMVFEDESGTYLVNSRFIQAFPELSIHSQKDLDPTFAFEVDKTSLISGMKLAQSGAAKDDVSLVFRTNGGGLTLSMKAAHNSKSQIEVPVASEGLGDSDSFEFTLNKTLIQKVLSFFNEANVRFKVHLKSNVGFVLLQEHSPSMPVVYYAFFMMLS